MVTQLSDRVEAQDCTQSVEELVIKLQHVQEQLNQLELRATQKKQSSANRFEQRLIGSSGFRAPNLQLDEPEHDLIDSNEELQEVEDKLDDSQKWLMSKTHKITGQLSNIDRQQQ